jgi:hypothetical protein
MTIHRISAALSAASLLALTACGGAATGAPPVSSVNPTSPSYSSLQFAVGTANLYGTGTGLNIVSTFRQGSGASATGVNSPTISGSFVVTNQAYPPIGGFADPYSTAVNGGPSVREVGGSMIGSTPQTLLAGTPECDGPGPFPAVPANQISSPPSSFVTCPSGLSPNSSTFGQSGGVFANGIQPANAVAASGQGYSYAPYAQPMYGLSDPTSQYTFVPWGGPPAFDPNGDGMGERDGVSINGTDSFNEPYFLGVGEGITVFDGLKVSSGSYSLAVAVATINNNGSHISTLTKTASLNVGTLLPTISSPVFTPDGNGGGTLNAVLPAGVTEAYIQIVDYGPGGGPNDGAASNPGNCQGPRGTSFAPVYYTLHVTASGTATLPDNIGPNSATKGGATALTPSPSICDTSQNTTANKTATNGDDIVVQTIGFDYPAYNAALSVTKGTQNPAIVGAAGQSDITISQAAEQDNAENTAVPPNPQPLIGHRHIVKPSIHRIRR